MRNIGERTSAEAAGSPSQGRSVSKERSLLGHVKTSGISGERGKGEGERDLKGVEKSPIPLELTEGECGGA